MKKLLFGVAAMILMVSCNGKKESSENAVDSVSVKDTVALTIAEDTAKNQIVEDSAKNQTVEDAAKQEKSVKQDSTKTAKKEKDNKPSPNAKLIDKYLTGYLNDGKQYKQAISYGMMGAELAELQQYGRKAQKRLKKYENEMTPEQKEKFKKANKMFGFN